MSRRKICVVTTTRAEYGLLYWLLKEIQADDALELQLAVSGTHLSPAHGSTYKVIEDDGFKIDARIDMQLKDDSPVGTARSMALALNGFAEAFARLQPDLLVLLGDRYELLAAAEAAMLCRIPIAHLHGGEATQGAFDEAIRHALTKMAQLHFVAAEPYRKRVIQLGEQPERVMNFGAPGLDFINRAKLMSREELEQSLGFELGESCFLVTYHPVTLDSNGPRAAMSALFEALDSFAKAKVIFTGANADPLGLTINTLVAEFAARQPDRVKAVASLGQLRYLSAVKHCQLVLGNSSSGIIEAPAMKRATVNLGDRQRGRLRAASILDCAETAPAIKAAVQQALSPQFQAALPGTVSLYGTGQTSSRIKDHLKAVKLDGILMKTFYDLPGAVP